MRPRLACGILALALCAAHAQTPAPAAGDVNLQNLLASLTNGSQATLVTPLANGMLQVTTFQPSLRLSAPEAAAAVNRAHQELVALGEPNPTADELARMLAGGPIDVPAGRITAPGILAESGRPAVIRSELVAAGTPLALPGLSAAAGGTAPAPPVAARETALQQLAALGILNPTEEQIRTALIGGMITTVNGGVRLPGILR